MKPNKTLLSVIWFCSSIIIFNGCVATNQAPKQAPTGKVGVVVEKEVANEKTGAIQIQAQRLDEIAERSVSDKGAEALLTPQRYASMGNSFFSSYDIGSKNEVIASIYNQSGKNGSDLWIFKNGKIRLTKTNYNNNYPSFSSNGKYVYFVADRGRQNTSRYDQNSYIWRMPSNGGGGLTRIGTPSYRFLNPIESPDGTKILFSSREFYDNSPFIWYEKRNGSLPTQLKQGVNASWLDNNTIIFSAKDENTGFYSIWTADIDGSNLTQIIYDNEMDCLFPEADPFGQYIAYVKQRPNNIKSVERQSRDIYIYHLKENLSQQITTNISRDDMPHWSPEGDYLYFRSSRGLAWSIWRLSTNFLKN